MALKYTTIRPGLLVSLRTSVRGNVKYERHDILTDEAHSQWTTDRLIADPVEHKAATKAQSEARRLVTKVCTKSLFGLLCPEGDAEKLEAAIKDARKLTEEFNTTASLSNVQVYVITGKVASDDVEAVKSITGEVMGLMSKMEDGLKNMEVKKIRQAASDAKQVSNMLAPDAAARVQIAVEAVRASARQIVKAGEQAAKEVDLATIRRVKELRTSFLDIGEANEIARPVEQARAVDFAG